MPITTTAPIKQALVQTMRDNVPLKTAVVGGFHEGFAPTKKPYPLLTYNIAYAPYSYQWGSVMLLCGIDIVVWHTSSVDAENIDALVFATLHDASLALGGQTTLICRRAADLRNQDVDEEGNKVYAVGGTYEIWTDQPL